MTSLMQAACADVREAASYAKETMPMSDSQMTNERAADVLARFSEGWMGETRQALLIAFAALRAQAEPGPQEDREELIRNLNDQLNASESARCEFVTLYRDATDRADRLWRLVAMLQDLLDAKEAGL